MQIALILVLFAAAAAPARAQRPANDPQARSLRGTALIRKPNGSGTGWIVEWEKGLMVTNEYVVEQVEVIVPLSNSEGRPIADLAS